MPLFLTSVLCITIGVSGLVAILAYRLGYKRACEDLSIRRPAGIIRRADVYDKSTWQPYDGL